MANAKDRTMNSNPNENIHHINLQHSYNVNSFIKTLMPFKSASNSILLDMASVANARLLRKAINPRIAGHVILATAGFLMHSKRMVDIKAAPPEDSTIICFKKSIARFLASFDATGLSVFSMERFSFQRMGKGMQPSRCLAILGETLRPIPASRIYGGSV